MKASISIHSLVPRKNCLGEAESFSTLLNSKPSGLMYCLAGFKTMIIYPPKMVHQSSYLATQSIFFLLDFHFHFVQINIEVRQDIPEFLNANLLSIHIVALDIDWKWHVFSLHNFFSMLIMQVLNYRKVRTEDLKVGTDLLDLVIDGWSVTQ